jgi:hypothetical protein
MGAAILIVGLLFLATSPAGRKVLGVALILLLIGGVGILALLHQMEKGNQARNARDAQEAKQELASLAESEKICSERYPLDPNARSIIAAELARGSRRDCVAKLKAQAQKGL